MQPDEARGPGERMRAAGRGGRILFSTDAAASAVAAAEADGAALFAVDAIRVGEGETLVVQAAAGQPVRVETGLLEVADGGRVAAETFLELHADRAVFAPGSAIELVGTDGEPGKPGDSGFDGGHRGGGSNGGMGSAGGNGGPGPGGTLYFREISGTLTVVAGGGRGGDGGPGGRGGRSSGSLPLGPGNGGYGGAGGRGGDGGMVIIRYETIAPGGAVNLVVRLATPGAGGKGGEGGRTFDTRPDGAPGRDGARGSEGWPPGFSIRPGG